MKLIDGVTATETSFPNLVLTIGSFDGVHLGHRAIIERVRQLAHDRGGTAGVMTMQPHPREVFSPDKAPNLLSTTEKKLALFDSLGIDVAFVLEFTHDVANLDRQQFIEQIVVRRCHAAALVVGHDFCFGKNAAGDYLYLQEVAPRYGFSVEQVPPLRVAGERVSSTLIRERLLQGDLERARELLGRRYSITGEVVPGRGIGRKLGFPTANVRPYHSAVPAQGVYVAAVTIDGMWHAAALNIGIAPTIRHEDQTIEAHILDFDRDIRGTQIEIEFHKRLRPERKFPSHEALMDQIRRDVEEARAYFVKRSD